MGTYTIGEMARKLNRSVKTLQRWDNDGTLPAFRHASNRRYYTHDQYLEFSGKAKYKCTGDDIDAIKGKVVLITGGTGSLGQKLTERICDYAKKVIIYSRCELKQAIMRQKFSDKINIRYMIGDIRDRARLAVALRGVDVCIHCAALKRVEVNTYNPTEGIATNINGTANVAQECIDAGVSKALFISSDKAAEPITPYGYMKAMGESCWINFNNYASDETIFMATRYGNVINSNGSFYHTIKQQVESGLIQVTDLKMTRFYMTLDQAVDLNLFALNKSISGEIFIPKIKSASIMDFIAAFGPDTPTKVIGTRGIEKLAECLIGKYEMPNTYECGDYFKIVPDYIDKYNMGWDRDRPKENQITPFRYTSSSKDVEKLTAQDLIDMVAG